MKTLVGPRQPRLIQSLRMLFQPQAFLQDCAQHYGECFTLNAGALENVVYTSSPDLTKLIFSDSKHFAADVQSSSYLQTLLGKNSVLLLEGELHQRQRRLILPAFHGEQLSTYGKLIIQQARQAVEQLPKNQHFNVHHWAESLIFDIVFLVIFGQSQTPHLLELKQRLLDTLGYWRSPLLISLLLFPLLKQNLGRWSPWGRYLLEQQKTDQLLIAEVQKRQKQNDPSQSDVLSLLLSARYETGQPMTNEEIRDEIVTLLLLSHESTATALAWALFWLDNSPDAFNRLQDEIDQHQDSSDPNLINRLPYLNAVVQETLRISPPVPILRYWISKAPFVWNDYQFAEGTRFNPCPFLIHLREDLYPQPRQFRPERFLEKQFSSYEFLPFGGGNRYCIGMSFALYELKLILFTILSTVWLCRLENRPINSVYRAGFLVPTNLLMKVMGGDKRQKVGSRR